MEVRSEPVSDQGGRREGTRDLTADLAPAELLVRETVQNSWDARLPDEERTGPVDYLLHGRTLSDDQCELLRRLLPVEDRMGFASHDLMEHPRATLSAGSVDVLLVGDRGTLGLCGPTRGSEPRGTDARGHRFVDFIRNSGRLPDTVGGGDGGSYGLGKSVLWDSSRCGTVLVHLSLIHI